MSARVRFAVSRRVPVPAAEIWQVLGDWGGHRWTRTLRYCKRDTDDVRVGTARVCTLPRPLMGRTEVTEKLTEYVPGVALAYVLDGPAGPFSTAESRWSTNRLSDNSTLLTVEGQFAPRNWAARIVLWPLVKPRLRRLTLSVIRELEGFVLNERARPPA